MTAFLSRLVERATSAAEGVTTAHPIVPPLFAAGPSLDLGETLSHDRQDGTQMNLGGEADPAPFTASPLLNDREAAQTDARATATVMRLANPQPAAPSAIPVSSFADREPAQSRMTTLSAGNPDAPSPIVSRLQQHVTVAPFRQSRIPTRLDVGAGPVLPAPRSRRQDRAVAPDPAPTVRVTIGRIEVRAVTAPAPQQVAPPAQPKRTAIVLEDYLRSGSTVR